LQNRPVPEVVEMAVQHQTPKKSSVLAMTKREEKLRERKERLDDLLLSAVDEALNQVFKKEGTEAIYNILGDKCHLKLEEIAEKPEDFAAGARASHDFPVPSSKRKLRELLLPNRKSPAQQTN